MADPIDTTELPSGDNPAELIGNQQIGDNGPFETRKFAIATIAGALLADANADIAGLLAADTSLSTRVATLESGQGSGGLAFTTLSALTGSLNYAANTKAEVVADPTPANNGVYQKQGASGSGSWTKLSSDTLASKAPLNSPDLIAAKTTKPAANDNSNLIPNTSWVQAFGAVLSLLRKVVGPAQFALTDGAGTIWTKITPTQFLHPVIDTIRAQIASAKLGNFKTAVGPAELALTDDAGSRYFSITQNNLRHKTIDAHERRIARNEGPPADPAYDDVAMLAERIGVHVTGQSLANGNSNTAISTTPSTHAERFNGGIRAEDASNTDFSGNRTSIVAGASETNMTTGFTAGGESPLTGMVEMIVQLLAEEDGYDPLALGQKFLLAGDGHGGGSIEGMLQGVPGEDVYTRVTLSMSRAASLYEAAGKSYTPGFVAWVQGETNNIQGTSYASYLSQLQQVQAQFETYARTNIVPGRRLPLLTYQVATHIASGAATPNVALAQLAACADPKFVFVGPAYPFPKPGAAANLHLSAIGSKWMGFYFGLAAKRLLWDRIKIQPLVPVFRAQGNNGLMRFPTLERGRKIVGGATTAVIPSLATWGVTAVNAAGAARTLSNPRVAGRDLIVFDLAETPADVWKFRCAWVGDAERGYTNIRDDNPLIADRTNLQLPMQKWVPICEVPLST